MKKHARSPKALTLNRDKLRVITPNALVYVHGGTAYPGTEYDEAPTPNNYQS